MSNQENICMHLNEVIDDREGSIICIDCGLVLSDNLYHADNYLFHLTSSVDKDLNEIKELLERLNLPEAFSSQIFDNYKKLVKERKRSKYLLPYTIYQTLNEIGYPISIKDISAVSGVSENLIYDMQKNEESIILNPDSLLEKYCKILDLDYKTYSVIKERLPKIKTGHNPLTVIASTIYKYCKENKLKYSMKYIAHIVKISPISIRRYLKQC
jgi:transcription initiation factor TFIIIB Brf1 subunit/transcription initiation factor TFIIB